MAPHSSTLAWKIPWMVEPGGLQSMGSLRVGHDWATSFSLFTFMHWRRKWQPTPVFLPGESQQRGAWWAAIYGVAQSWTRLKLFSSNWVWAIFCTYYPLPLCQLHPISGANLYSTLLTDHPLYFFCFCIIERKLQCNTQMTTDTTTVWLDARPSYQATWPQPMAVFETKQEQQYKILMTL